MADGINPIASLQGRVIASGALAITIVASTGQAAGSVGTAASPIMALPGRVTSDNSLVVQFG